MFYFPLLMALFSTGFRYQKLFKVPHAAHLLLAQPTLQQMVKVDKHSTVLGRTLAHLVGHLDGRKEART